MALAGLLCGLQAIAGPALAGFGAAAPASAGPWEYLQVLWLLRMLGFSCRVAPTPATVPFPSFPFLLIG